MLPNLSALDHRAPLASTGPQVSVDKEGATCPISLEDMPKGSLAWQPEVVDRKSGKVGRELQQFYELAYLATWLESNRATPMRNIVTDADRRDCILAANEQRAQRGQRPLRVPALEPIVPAEAYSLDQFPAELPRPRRRETQGDMGIDVLELEQRNFLEEGQDQGQALFEEYDALSGADAYSYLADDLKKARMKLFIANHYLSARAVYALAYVTAQEASDMERVPESLPESQAPEAPYTPQQDDGIFRRIAGQIENYTTTRGAQQTYAELRKARLRKSRLMAAAALAHCAAVCKPAELAPPVQIRIDYVPPDPVMWMTALLVHARPYSDRVREAFDLDVRERNERKRLDYANDLVDITGRRATRSRWETNAVVVASLASAAAAAVAALAGLR